MKTYEVRTYIRDGRAPIPKDELTSRVMSSIKGKNTKPELLLRKAISRLGIRGYRLHWKDVPGRPDISFVGKKIAVFVNGCFWHRCPYCRLSLPKSNSKFWQSKFQRNVERDSRKVKQLKALNWTVLTIWECQIKTDVITIAESVQSVVNSK